MARVTVEDCIDKVQNRFELVMVAAQRARKLGSGAQMTVPRDNDKFPVVSLREIAGETVDTAVLKEEIVTGYQRFQPQDEEEEKIDLMDGEKEWAEMAGGETGLYAEEDVAGDDDEGDDEDEDHGEPSLGDVAGV